MCEQDRWGLLQREQGTDRETESEVTEEGLAALLVRHWGVFLVYWEAVKGSWVD
jgi:hypothetical protein